MTIHNQPIPPLSVIKYEGEDEIRNGKMCRVGYYSHQAGIDVIWLVDQYGEYNETIDHLYLREFFVVIKKSDEADLFGDERPEIKKIENFSADWEWAARQES